jgi:hypothetical protein
MYLEKAIQTSHWSRYSTANNNKYNNNYEETIIHIHFDALPNVGKCPDSIGCAE